MRPLAALGAAMRSASINDPSTPLTPGVALSAVTDAEQLWTGGGQGGDPLRVGAALRCVQVLSSAVAGCPIRVQDANGDAVRIEPLLVERAGTTPFEMWETVVAHLALWGNAYLQKIRARDGRVLALAPIHPHRVTVELVDAAPVLAGVVKRFVIDGRRQDALTEHEVMHIPGMSTNGVTGISVIANVRRSFGLASNAEMMADRLYEQGMLLSGFLSTKEDLSSEKAEILKTRWRAKLAGIDNAYDVAVLDKGTTFQQLSMSPADAQFLETRKYQTTEIARLFGLPGWIINDQEKSTSWGSGMEQQFISFVVLSLQPYFKRIEQRITRELCDPRTETAEFKVEGLLRGDSQARAAFYNAGITGGWMTPNDIRPLENLKPVAWGDAPYRPYNHAAGDPNPTDPGGESDGA